MPRLSRRSFLFAALFLLAGCATGTASSLHTSASRLHFPADQAAHVADHNEWWYVVGHLRSGTHRFGFEATLFRFRNVQPPGFTAPVTLYRTDLAISDISGGRFYHRITPYFPSSAHISGSVFNERAGTLGLSGPPDAMRLTGTFGQEGLHLTLDSLRPQMNVGGSGYLPFGNGFTYYYSLTDLRTGGTVRVGGRSYRVTGLSWLDHQWGNWSWRAIKGWTWMALQLSNGTQLSLFDFRGTRRVRGVSIMTAGGRTRTARTVTITPTGTWRSPHTGAVYPSGWRVAIPALRASLTITPALRDQEMTVGGDPVASYWEGAGTVTGTLDGRSVTGGSYTELTGFVHRPGGTGHAP